MTRSPRRGPGGIEICSLSWRFSAASASATSLSYALMRALPLACRARGAMPHPFELALRACGGASRRPSPPPRAAAPSARASSCSCLPTGCRARGRARGSSPRRCRGSSGRGSPRRRCRGTPAGGVRARQPISASRWLVGSSSSSRSGLPSSSRHSATRRRSPPLSVVDVGVGAAAAAARPSRSRAGGRGPSR